VNMAETILTTMPFSAALVVEERRYGDKTWVALRARGAEWSMLTPDEAIEVGRAWIEKYSR
jgi:hypothetical protein